MIMIVIGSILATISLLMLKMNYNMLIAVQEAKRLKISTKSPYLPDYVIDRGQPLRFKIGDKHLYLQPMTSAKFSNYVQLMAEYFTRWKMQLEGVNFGNWKELKDNSVSKFVALMANKQHQKSMDIIFKKAILQDPNINKEHITLSYLHKHCTIDEIAQLWAAIYDYCIGSVRPFFERLLETLAGEGREKTLCGLWANLDSAANKHSDYQPRKLFYGAEGLVSEQRETTQNTSAIEKNQIKSK